VNPWLPFGGRIVGDLRLYCLPHAGAGATVFRSWLERIPGVAVRPVLYPGRESRAGQPAHDRMDALVGELVEVVAADAGDRPYAVYGHSLGAFVAFELVRGLRAHGGPQPRHLFVSGCVAPGLPLEDGPPVTGMSRTQLVEMLRRLGGTPDWLLNDPQMADVILPPVRADFAIRETWTYRPEAPLTLPVTVIASTDDPRAAVADQERWREHTTGPFVSHTLHGGHFAVFEQPETTFGILHDGLSALA
jgi:surfactin synthase thioesterase subunit